MKGKIVAVALLALVFGVQSLAQTYYGGLRGTVTDPTGQAIAGATVKVKGENTNLERSTITKGYGEDGISSIDPCSCNATGTAPRFQIFGCPWVGVFSSKGLTLV